mmetsp:Transcript_54495/g.177135  ORF Transcript_54495/g.177135 Transcript_54495/m.177135 type:complete len:160 (-) Transcript_54495:8-487(-)
MERSKTGVSDDAIVLDRPDWLGPFLMELKRGRAPLAPLFNLDLASGIKLWDIACRKLRVKAHRYQLRHAWASSDMLARRRTEGEIMARLLGSHQVCPPIRKGGLCAKSRRASGAGRAIILPGPLRLSVASVFGLRLLRSYICAYRRDARPSHAITSRVC